MIDVSLSCHNLNILSLLKMYFAVYDYSMGLSGRIQCSDFPKANSIYPI